MDLPADKFKQMLPVPVTVITTVDAAGIFNAAPYGCVIPILDPLDLIAVASAPPRHTLHNIRETGHFVINVIGTPSFDKAMKTAKNYPPEVNELAAVGLETIPAKRVSPPRIKDALGWIEAVLQQEVINETYSLIIGKVVCAEMNDAYCREGQLVETPLVMLSPYYRRLGEKMSDLRELRKRWIENP